MCTQQALCGSNQNRIKGKWTENEKSDGLLSVLAQQGPPKFAPSLQLNVIHSPV
jgi:hypothetical protein